MKKRRISRFRLDVSRWALNYPGRLSIFGFMVLILSGTVLLMMPAASTGAPVGFINALFTATSASCVTGLAVMDTGTGFTGFGQLVILFMIQAGGLGIMTLSTLLLMVAGGKPGFTGRTVIYDTFTHRKDMTPAEIIREVIGFALIIELVGAASLFACFAGPERWDQAAYLAVFHSISAFCNAGFCLFPQSLSAYRSDFFLNAIICFLIILGGIGFLVLSEVKQFFSFKKRKWARLSLHSKLVLSSTVFLLVASTLLILALEWQNTLAPLSFKDRLTAAFFQAVTTRTAGFNTLPIAQLANETLFLFILLMFIGAAPGSCAGGVKVTTFATLMSAGWSRLKGTPRPQVFRRTIAGVSLLKAINVVILSGFIVCGALFILLWVELGDVSHIESRGRFLELMFEVVSAFGTVGLTADVTGTLTATGKLIITAVMFVGRLGPLVIGAAISRQSMQRYHYAEEEIMVG